MKSLRHGRWVILMAIVAIVGGIGVTYRAQQRVLSEQSPAKPDALPLDLKASATNWHWEQKELKPPFRTMYEITAEEMQQVKETSEVKLTNVELKLYHKGEDVYDLIKSAAATFTAADRKLYSEGAVEITLGVPVEGKITPDLVRVQTSGVHFDSATGKAETDRPAAFQFEHGEGKAVGAIYDPTVKALEMKTQVEILWRGPDPKAKPMKIESAMLQYYEATSEIWLREWGRLTRGNSVIEGEEVVVHLEEDAVRRVEALRAHGTDSYPDRKLSYQAEQVWVHFGDTGQVERVIGERLAQLVSESARSRTTITGNRVELDFAPGEEESALTQVRTEGQSAIESKPLPVKGRAMGETQVLRSERIELAMKPGGKEIEKVVTQTPGVLEFLPNLPAQRRRVLEGSRMTIAYGAENRPELFEAKDAKTRTEPNAEEKKRNRAVAVTTSKELRARFEPGTSRMSSLEQWGDFEYEEGDRKARAAKGRLDSGENVMALETGARVWDASGSTSADRIRMDQGSGDFTAEGKVNSTRMAAEQKGSGMLSGDEPVHAQAERMEAANRNRLIRYTGKVTMWQGANRISGEAVTIDREKGTLAADGNVVSQLWDRKSSAQGKGKKAGPPVLTVVRAAHLRYTEQDRLAHYTGGVVLTRPGLSVKGRELRAWLAESGSESSLERAVADGKVEIAQSEKGRSRNGTGEHAEYYVADQRIVLRGGEPQLIDSARGRTRGAELTYYANDDRLLVNGAADRPARSVIPRK